MLMSGLGALAAVIRVPQAHASVSNAPAAPPPGGASVNYVFQDDFNGPAGSAPDASKWLVAKARESMEDPTFWELPEHVSLIGLPPKRFGVTIECVGADAYAVVVLWDRTRFAWDGLTRVQLLTSSLAPLLQALGNDLRSTLEQSARPGPRKLQKVA